MSAGARIPLAEARDMADALVDLLRPDCARIEIAGSIRRERETVGDIEIVAIPHHATQIVSGLFESTEVVHDLLEQGIRVLLAGTSDAGDALAARPVANHRADGSIDVQTKLGPSFKALTFRGFPVDLFITDAERWGLIFALRTGPGDWNTKLVTECKRYFRRVEDGRVLHLGRPVACPEEMDFFRAIGQPWVEPRERHVDRVHIVPPDSLGAS